MEIKPLEKGDYSRQRKLRRAKRLSRKADVKENVIQKHVDGYLDAASQPYLRIPDAAFNFVMNSPHIPEWVKMQFGAYLAGWPDNMILKGLYGPYALARMIENKTKVGRCQKSQRARQEYLDVEYDIVRDVDQIRGILREFEEVAGSISHAIWG